MALVCCCFCAVASSLDFEIMNRMFLRFVKCFPLIGQFFFCDVRHNDDRMEKNRGIPDENEWKCLEQIFMWATVVSILYVSFFFCRSLARTLDSLSFSALHFCTLFSFCSLAFAVVEREISINNNRSNHFSNQTTNFAARCMDSSKEMTKPMATFFPSFDALNFHF